jgi:hypothetical protein
MGLARPFRRAACKHGLEGVVSKQLDWPYLPGDRGAWIKSKCLNRAEFVIACPHFVNREGAVVTQNCMSWVNTFAAKAFRRSTQTGCPNWCGVQPGPAG